MTTDAAAEPTIVRRDIPLDVDRDEAWGLIGDAGGWALWLVDDAQVDVAVGSIGTVREDGVSRQVSVTRIDEGRSVEFVWWSDREPGRASSVSLTLDQGDDGRAVARVVEACPPQVAPSAARAALRWEVRAAVAWSVCLAGARV